MANILHVDLRQDYTLTKDKDAAYRFDGKDIAQAAVAAYTMDNRTPEGRKFNYSYPQDGNGVVVTVMDFDPKDVKAIPALVGYMVSRPKPSIALLYDAINEHQAAVRAGIHGAKGNYELARASANIARDVLITKLAEWGVADKFDLSDLDN